MNTPRPIGYWLKHLHELLERQLEVTLAGLGLGRRHWQILNTLDGGARTPAELRAALAPFWSADAPALDAVLARLAELGWTRRAGDGSGALLLTGAGRAAHQEAAARIAETRALVLAGLTPEQYGETVRVLSVMAGNVEAALAGR
ncbi:MarR family winged helix-turn-helix transcriptional regulator [Streptomyces hoynatensis]|uniref:MarR family transcriptional regulator n=1 Tax=Streptomyces hoynatensis TaxID=1141874 RepID=A0A3A9YWT3_9ACTN|nr:MarR family transcriptional regulator [Streptomyces hoynatensis]RKN40084.1 MarR family transcriptional regulator [Streptomyces hoynatensis]